MTSEGRPPSTERSRQGRRRVPPEPPTDRRSAGSTPSGTGPGPAPGTASAELVARIRAEIEASPDRRITFARFMERALYEPDLGYYRQPADRPTEAGDFLTAPETHPIFGWTLARRIEATWAKLGRPSPFHLVEYGAGSGTLALAILDGMRRHGADPLLAALRYEPVESNPNRLADLERHFAEAGLTDRLAGRTDASRSASPAGRTAESEAVPVTGVILANEFLDALPVHRAVIREGRVRELFVTWRVEGAGHAGAAALERERFVEVEGEPSTPLLAGRLADDGLDPGRLAEGQVLEICPGLEPWLDEVAARLGGGFALIVDYGYPAAELYGPRHVAGSLLGYRAHRAVEDPFEEVGRTDLTAHVDFTALAVLAERRGLHVANLETQSEFLVGAGLEAELQALQASPETSIEDYLRARSGIVRMLDPRHMGRFRVLTLAR
jgi:SAM-dependent MidA family methyltransferase